jgi:cobalt-precorrin 5A hydrolase
VEYDAVKVAGFGFRQAASCASLRNALSATGNPEGIDALATVSDKAAAPALIALAEMLGIPIHAIPAEALSSATTISQSARSNARFGTGSVAEASALIAAGIGSRLLAPRAASNDGMVMAAIAISQGPGQ